MAEQILDMAEELVHDDAFPCFPGKVDPTDIDGDIGSFASIDDLEYFLAKFNEGIADEAFLQTQGDADVGGEPVTTIH